MSKARLLPVLLRRTRLFYLEIPAPLDMAAMERALHFSVSVCLPPSDSIAPSFSAPTPTWSHKNVVAQKKKLDFIVDGRVILLWGGQKVTVVHQTLWFQFCFFWTHKHRLALAFKWELKKHKCFCGELSCVPTIVSLCSLETSSFLFLLFATCLLSSSLSSPPLHLMSFRFLCLLLR